MRTITVKFFATYQELAGTDQVELQIEEDATVLDVIEDLKQDYPELSKKLATVALIAVNEKYARQEQKLYEHDTVAFFPLVSGG